MNESSLAQLLSGILGRQVNAAPSMANGGVPYSPVQSAAPTNLSSLLLGMLFGGMGGATGGYSGGGNQGLVVPTRTDYPASYYQQPTQTRPQLPYGAAVARDGVGTISYPADYMGVRYPTLVEFNKAGGVYGSPSPLPQTPSFIDWMWTQMTGQQPPSQGGASDQNYEWGYGQDGKLTRRYVEPGTMTGQMITPWGPNTGYSAGFIKPGYAGTAPVTQTMIDQYYATQKPQVPQTGPTVDGKTYYPSPLPGAVSPNPTTNTQTPYPTSTVQPYQPGSFKPQPLPQMWNPSSFYPGYQGGGFFGGGFNSWQPWKTDPTGFQNAWTNRNNPPERLRAFDGGYSQLKDAINFQQGKPSTGPDSVAYTPAPTTYSPTITPSTVNSIDYPQNRGSMAKFFSNLFGGQR